MAKMTTPHPYLVRAFYDWISDNGMTPHISVDLNHEGVEVPRKSAADDEIVLNIGSAAVRDLDIGLEYISFNARFSGAPHQVFIPVAAVHGIFAKESGEGMAFAPQPADQSQNDQDGGNGDAPKSATPSAKHKKKTKPILRVVK